MANHLIAIDYQDFPVLFTEDGWINATVVAAHYGKRVEHYLDNSETKEYISELCNADNTRNSGYYECYIKSKKGKNGGTGQTAPWTRRHALDIHQSLESVDDLSSLNVLPFV